MGHGAVSVAGILYDLGGPIEPHIPTQRDIRGRLYEMEPAGKPVRALGHGTCRPAQSLRFRIMVQTAEQQRQWRGHREC